MSSHAVLRVVRGGVAVPKGTGVRINYIVAEQIDVGVDLKGYACLLLPINSFSNTNRLQFDMRSMTNQFPTASLQSKEVSLQIS